MLKNNIKTNKISLNTLQLMKSGLHIGGWLRYNNVSSQPFLSGKKHNLVMLDTNLLLASVRRVIFLIRKITLKKEKIFLLPKNWKELQQTKSIFSFIGKKSRNGLLTNRQFTNKTQFFNKLKKNYMVRDSIFSSGRKKKMEKDFISKYKKIKLPSMALFFREENNKYAILETRKKKIISSIFLDTYCDLSVTQYPVLNNNNSLSSLKYFYKILNLALTV